MRSVGHQLWEFFSKPAFNLPWMGGLIAVVAGALLNGCTTVPGNPLLLTEGHGNLMKEVMERKDKIISLSPLDPDKPALLLLHGATDDPTEMMDIVREWRGQYNVFLYSYNYHNRVEKAAADLTCEMTKLKAENRFPPTVTVLVYSYSAIVFREAVITGKETGLFANASLIQLVPTAGGSFMARTLRFPIAAFLVSLASATSTAENPYGSFAEKIWDGAGNKKFYEVINPLRMHTILVEGDSHSLAGVKNKNVQRRYKNGIGPNVVVIPKSTGVTHDYFPTQPAALAYLRTILELPHNLDEPSIPKPTAAYQTRRDPTRLVAATAAFGPSTALPAR
jgi:hypothetical protein